MFPPKFYYSAPFDPPAVNESNIQQKALPWKDCSLELACFLSVINNILKAPLQNHLPIFGALSQINYPECIVQSMQSMQLTPVWL